MALTAVTTIFLIFAAVITALALLYIGYLIGRKIGRYTANREWEDKVQDIRSDAVKRSRAVLAGQFSEQLSPFMPGFQYSPSDCRFIGKPVDLIVFRGMDNREIEEVVFIEVKTAGSRLSQHEKKLKETIENKKVRWEEYRADEN